MLSRLNDLHMAVAAANLPVAHKHKEGEEGEEDAPQWHAPKDQKISTRELDEYLEFLDEMHECYKELLVDEGATVQACAEIEHHVINMEETIQLEKESILPSRIAQMSNRFDGQELVCQRMINRAKGMLDILKNREVEVHCEDAPAERSNCRKWLWPDQERLAHNAPMYMDPVRQSIAKARADEYRTLVLRFFQARSTNKSEVLRRTTRQLRFAFPDAEEAELDQVMECPDNAAVALSKRLEKGDKVTLVRFIEEAEADAEKQNQKKLEQGAKELKLMMLQFSELIDNQGEALNAIEANIKMVLEETTEAIAVLNDALEAKLADERQRRCVRMCGCCCLLMFAFLIWGWIASVIEEMEHPGTTFLKKTGLSKYTKYFSSRKSSKLQLQVLDQHVFHESEQWLDKHLPHVQGGQGPAPHTYRVVEKRKPRPGFIAPRASLLENPVLRGVALTARGTAARHSGLRKRREVMGPDNAPDT